MRKSISKFALAAILGFALAFIFSCSIADDDDNGGGYNCNLNGETVNIGDQVWMAENLNCNVSGSKCYNNQESNCQKYGRLYNWETAMKVCPEGWHLPSQEEWLTLRRYINNTYNNCPGYAGHPECDATHLKSTSGWNGLDSYNFSALPGGLGFSDGGFNYGGDRGYWWTASQYSGNDAYSRGMHTDDAASRQSIDNKSDFVSVRCLQN